jgi:hypothetical protein
MALLGRDDVLFVGTLSPATTMSDLASDDWVVEPTIAKSATARHHKSYYFEEEGFVTLKVENTVFRVHAYLFTRESDEARAFVERALKTEGHTIVEGATAEDLEHFCNILYCRFARLFLVISRSLTYVRYSSASSPVCTKDEWTSVLHLSHRWNFASIRSLAIKELSVITLPVDRIVLGHAYGIGGWLLPAYQTLCERDEWLSDEEGRCLGIDHVLKIIRARVAIRAKAPILDSSTCTSIIAAVFDTNVDALTISHGSPSNAGSPVAPSMSTNTHIKLVETLDMAHAFLVFAISYARSSLLDAFRFCCIMVCQLYGDIALL